MAKDYFSDAVNSVSTTMSSKRDIVEWARDTYGAKDWSRKLAEHLQPHMLKKDGQPMSIKSIQRNWQGSRATEQGATKKWREVGRDLPRQIKDNQITIHFEGTQKGNRGKKDRTRSWDVTLKGKEAREWVNNPTFDVLWDHIGIELGVDDEKGDIDPDYVLTGVHVSAA